MRISRVRSRIRQPAEEGRSAAVGLVGKASGCRSFKVAGGVCVYVVCVCVGVGQILRNSRAGGLGKIFERDVDFGLWTSDLGRS